MFGWVSPSDLTLPLWEVLVDESTSEVFPQFLGESPILGTEELLNEMREARPAAVLTFEESCEEVDSAEHRDRDQEGKRLLLRSTQLNVAQ